MLAELSGRFLFAVDDGSGMAADPRADIALIAEPGDPPALVLALAGAPTTLRFAPGAAAEAAIAAARVFHALAAASGENPWRIADLPGGAESVARELGARLRPGRLALSPGPALGAGMQNDGRVSVTALPPLGRLDRRCSQRCCHWSPARGASYGSRARARSRCETTTPRGQRSSSVPSRRRASP